jgi:hypothetical protein
MSPRPMLFPGLLSVALVCVQAPDRVRGEQADDTRLAKRLINAAEKYSELQDVVARHGQRAEIALTVLQKERYRAELHAEIRDRQSVIDGFYQNRRWWSTEQQGYFEQKLALDRELTELDRQLNDLRFQERQMFEEGLRQAEANGKAVKPFSREAILHDLQRLDRESSQAVAELKGSVEAAAQDQHTTPGQILAKAKDLASQASAAPPPDVLREFLKKFIDHAGGKSWLNGAGKKPTAGKNRGPSRKKKYAAQPDAAPF